MLRLNKFVLAACVSISALTGAAFAQDATVVAKVGNLEITQSELDLAIANLERTAGAKRVLADLSHMCRHLT